MTAPRRNEAELRDLLVQHAASLFARGFSVGSAGNISVRLDDGFLITPTNSSLGRLEAARISRLDAGFNHVGGDEPSKEVFLHRAVYAARQPGSDKDAAFAQPPRQITRKAQPRCRGIARPHHGAGRLVR